MALVAPKLKVLISGAGIAGPCLAYWLARTRLDVSVTIVERSPVPRATGQSIDIRGAAIEIVKRMKLEEAVRARSTTEEGTVVLNSAGKPFAEFRTDGPFTAEYEILRADMAELFLDATDKLRSVKYMYGDYITSLDQTEKNVVDVAFNSGSKGTYDLVVAADGGTSRTRSMILDDSITKGSYNFLGQYIAFFSIPRREGDPKLWQWYNTPKGLSIMLRPHRTPATVGCYLCVTMPARGQRDAAVEAAMDAGVDGQKRILHTIFANAGWQAERVLAGMDASTDFYMSRAAQVKLPQWTNNRALCIGDAANATFGVGTSLAIDAAYILAGELSKIKTSEDVPQALLSYESVFRPIYKKMEELPPGYPQLAFPQTRWGLWIRDMLIWMVSKSKVYKLLPADGEAVFDLPEYDWVDA